MNTYLFQYALIFNFTLDRHLTLLSLLASYCPFLFFTHVSFLTDTNLSLSAILRSVNQFPLLAFKKGEKEGNEKGKEEIVTWNTSPAP